MTNKIDHSKQAPAHILAAKYGPVVYEIYAEAEAKEAAEKEAAEQAAKDGEKKWYRGTGKWFENCSICYCSVSNQLHEQHMKYHENQTAISEAKSAAAEENI